MKMTRHFREDVVGPARHEKCEGITYERCVRIVRDRRYVEESGDERLFRGYAPELPGRTKWLRVVTGRDRGGSHYGVQGSGVCPAPAVSETKEV